MCFPSIVITKEFRTQCAKLPTAQTVMVRFPIISVITFGTVAVRLSVTQGTEQRRGPRRLLPADHVHLASGASLRFYFSSAWTNSTKMDKMLELRIMRAIYAFSIVITKEFRTKCAKLKILHRLF